MSSLLKSNSVRWILAVVITLTCAVYQRVTGPTYPISGELNFENSVINYKLTRTHGGEGDQPIIVEVADTSVSALLTYRRYPTNEEWTTKEMRRSEQNLMAELPHQPPAGKVEYYITFQKSDQKTILPADEKVITRFKGEVPVSVLIPHVLFMFLAMLLSARTGIEALDKKSNPRKLALWTFWLLAIGGMILGPVVQKYAFGELWTGVPFGWDLTDNKTLIAFLFWLGAIWAGRGGRKANIWTLAASLVTLVIFLIPHSLMGSEIKYDQ